MNKSIGTKLFVFLLLLVSIPLILQSQVAKYHSSYFGVDFSITASYEKNSKKNYITSLEVQGDPDTPAYILLNKKELYLFRETLVKLKDKYIEWAQIATENNVAEATKEINVKLPSYTITWGNSRSWEAFGKLTPVFSVEDGSATIILGEEVSALTNEYIREAIYIVFANEADFDSLYEALNPDIIESYLQNSSNTLELFK